MSNSIASAEHHAAAARDDFTDRKHSKKIKSYLLEALRVSNKNPPPDTDFQRGFQAALLVLFEDLCMTGNERTQHRIMETAAINNIVR